MSSFSHRGTAILAVEPTGILPVEPCNYAGKSQTLSDKFASSLEKVPTTSAQFETPALRYGRGFSKRNLEQMRLFYLDWDIAQTLSAQLTVLPHELAEEIEKTRRQLETRQRSR